MLGPLLEVEMSKKCTPLWREAHFEVKMCKKHQVRTTFWKLRCRKSARRCGAKHVSKSQCTKHTMLGPLLEVEMSKKCTPLWREAHFEVKMCKNTRSGPLFGSCDVEKVHAVVARSTFRSQNVQNTPCSDHFWKLRCRKSARRCGAKHISKSKCTKHHMFAPLLDVQVPFCVAGARDCAACQKWARRKGFVACPKTIAGVGHLNRMCKDAFSVAGAVQETCSSELLGGHRRSRRWFPERGCILEPEIFRFAEMILRDRCSTSYDLASLFRGRRCSLDKWIGNIAKLIDTRPSALHATLLCFWCCQLWKMKKSRRIASFLTLSSWNIEDISQNCSVSSSKPEDVSQNSFVFKLANRQVAR